MASAVKKKAKRTLVDVYNSARKVMGRRFNFLIREHRPKSTTSLEYGMAEVAKNYDLNSNKMIIERNAKLPRVLKDMLDMLLQEKQGDANNLCTFGILHSGKIRNYSIYCL